jgi:hypothetical protein
MRTKFSVVRPKTLPSEPPSGSTVSQSQLETIRPRRGAVDGEVLRYLGALAKKDPEGFVYPSVRHIAEKIDRTVYYLGQKIQFLERTGRAAFGSVGSELLPAEPFCFGTVRNMESSSKPALYASDHLYMSTFLVCRGHRLVGSRGDSSGRTQFLFIDSTELRSAIAEFMAGGTVEARNFSFTLLKLKKYFPKPTVEIDRQCTMNRSEPIV